MQKEIKKQLLEFLRLNPKSVRMLNVEIGISRETINKLFNDEPIDLLRLCKFTRYLDEQESKRQLNGKDHSDGEFVKK